MNRILIVGGGVAGVSLARALRFAPTSVTLIDRENFHVFAPRLYAAAVGQKAQRKSLMPLENALAIQRNAKFVRSDACFVDVRTRRLITSDRALPYDVLVVATGSRTGYPRSQWAEVAPGLKSPADAVRIRERLDEESPVLVVGGGATGVELAGALASTRRVVLLEQGGRLLPRFPEHMAEAAARRLAELKVDVRLRSAVVGVDASGVRFSSERGARTPIASRAVLWAGGTEGSAFGAMLAKETGSGLDSDGCVRVEPGLHLAAYPEIFVIGDTACAGYDGLATVAEQQARYVGEAIRARLAGYAVPPFQYVDKGRFVRVGGRVLGALGDTRLSGPAADVARWFARAAVDR